MNVIEIHNLTKDYGNHKGIFDVTIGVQHGEVFGFLGPNGAGKTTTIRHLMGFIRAKKGSCRINNLDCFKDASQIHDNLGYLAGEIAFLDDLKGSRLIDFIASLKRVQDKKRIEQLLEMFELDPKSKVKKMSKGMKQKVGIVCAFMNEPQVIILDEPTSGLDPLMQHRFIDLVLEEKKKGRTIFMSSHIFEEVERTCDRVAIIKNGDIMTIEDIDTLKQRKQTSYKVTFRSAEDAAAYVQTAVCPVIEHAESTVVVNVPGSLTEFLKSLTIYEIAGLDIGTQSLEDIFLHYYGGEPS